MITVVCPVYNEEQFIDNILSFFVNAEPVEKELLIIDGGSNDKTVSIVGKWQEKYVSIKLITNPNKYVPFALNLAIKKSAGDPIIRLDAHTEYSPDYFLKIIETFEKTGADIVGGPMNKVGKTNFQKAVAFATSTPLGIGDSKIHNIKNSGYSDHVYLGAWKRNLFNDIGFFDERLVRNQDDEFHYRAKSKGKKIYLNPDIKLWYHPRTSLKGLFKQYFQYGYYKPLVLIKVKTEIKIRHLVPSMFVLYLLSLPLIFITKFWLIPFYIYCGLILIISFFSKLDFIAKLYSLLVYPAIHIGYGSGFLLRLFNLKGR